MTDKMLLYIMKTQASKDVRGNIKTSFTISLSTQKLTEVKIWYMSDAMLDNVGVFNEAVLPST